jgi:PKD repeat protein
MQLIRLTFFILFLNTIQVFGQTADPCHKSTEGKDFWFGFMTNSSYDGKEHYVGISITSVYECKYDIYIGTSKIPISGIVHPNIPEIITFDWKQVEAKGSENIQERAIHLVSDNPLNVFALNSMAASTDAALIFPTESLGKEYYTMCYSPRVNWPPVNWIPGSLNSEFMIVASEDNTMVEITPSKVTDKGMPANTTYSITLNKGELYQVQSESIPDSSASGKGDLSGSYIKSDKPVALYSGSKITTVPGDANDAAADHLYEQIPPLQTWGRKFIAVPLKLRKKDTYRVLAAENNTTVRVGNKVPVLLNKGQYSDFVLLETEPSLIESDKPVLLAQYCNSYNIDGSTGVGDPFMVIVSPINQAREKVTFDAYKTVRIKDTIFINVIVKDNAVGKINLDSIPVTFLPLGGVGYSYAQVKISAGNHTLESTESGKGFIAYVYGFGTRDSYGYGVGYNLDFMLDLGGNVDANGKKLLVKCNLTEPLILNAGNGFGNYEWSTGETTPSIKITTNGWYKVKVTTNDGCMKEDSVELQIGGPKINLGRDTTICDHESLILDVGDQFTNYSWTTPQSPLTDQKITASNPGIYTVEAINKYGCKASDTIKISFTDKPKIDFSRLDKLICGKKSTVLDVTADKGNFTIQSLIDNQSFTGLNVSVPDFGTYDLQIKATDQFSCHSDTVIRFGFRKTPSIKLSIDSTTCYHYNLDVKYWGDANINTSDFIWIFGGDTINHGIGLDSYLVPLGINRTTRDLKVIVTDQGCPNDKTLSDIKVIPDLQMKVLDSLGCEPFTTKFVADNTETVTYDWDFGDGITLSGSTADPTNTYQKAGYYPVKLKVTTNKGCTNEVRIDSMIHVAPIPTVGFTPFAVECLELGNHEISYFGSGDQLDTYNWDLSKFDSEEIIQNPGMTQGPLVFNLKNKPQSQVRLSVISKYTCKSDTATILVKRKPDFSIQVSPNDGCAPFEALFTGKANDPVDQVSYSWDFGDGTHGAGDGVKHTYSEPDHKYDVVLTAQSSTTECFDSRKEFVQTYPNPTVAFSMDNKIVYNDAPTVNFLNESLGAETYSWNFEDNSTSDEKNPSHYFKVIGYRTVILEAFNEFFCSDTVSHQLLVALDHIFPPNAFSPNAPNLVDREYKLGSSGIATEGYHLTIMSRWNDIVFEAKDEIKGWNGLMSNGSMAPAGTYVWVLDFFDFLGRRHRQAGTVTVVY